MIRGVQGQRRKGPALIGGVAQELARTGHGVGPEINIEGGAARLAQAQLRNERVGHTLDATALVNEAYLKIARRDRADGVAESPLDRGRFFAMASRASWECCRC